MTVALCALAACAQPPAPVVKPAPPTRPPSIFRIVDGGVGPINASTPANLTAVRELVRNAGYTVRAIDDGGIELHVYDGNEHVLYIIPNEDGSLFNVHVVSPNVPITQHPEWVITRPLRHSDILTFCECWGTHPMCWRDGDHVAVGFDRECGGLESDEGRRDLEGTPIQRAVWNPKPFGEGDEDGHMRIQDLPDWIPRSDS